MTTHGIFPSAVESVAPPVEAVAVAAVGAGAAAAGCESVPVWRCIYSFAARSADELGLEPGELVCAARAPKHPEPGWQWGSTRGNRHTRVYIYLCVCIQIFIC